MRFRRATIEPTEEASTEFDEPWWLGPSCIAIAAGLAGFWCCVCYAIARWL